jgi:AcrR family transcriptional regulator
MSVRVGRRPGRPLGGQHVVDRDVVLDAAERVIRRDGSGVSLEAIAIEAGVTKPVVYARVGGRAEMANALAERLSDRMVAAGGEALSSTTDEQSMVAAMIKSNLITVAEHRELFLYVTGGTADESPLQKLYLAERSATPLAAQLAAWRAQQGFATNVAVPWAYAVIGMLQMASLWWLTAADQTVDELAEQLSELLWSGLAGPRER